MDGVRQGGMESGGAPQTSDLRARPGSGVRRRRADEGPIRSAGGFGVGKARRYWSGGFDEVVPREMDVSGPMLFAVPVGKVPADFFC